MKWPLAVRWRSKLIWAVRWGANKCSSVFFLLKTSKKTKQPQDQFRFFFSIFRWGRCVTGKKRQEEKWWACLQWKTEFWRLKFKKKSKWILSRADGVCLCVAQFDVCNCLFLLFNFMFTVPTRVSPFSSTVWLVLFRFICEKFIVPWNDKNITSEHVASLKNPSSLWIFQWWTAGHKSQVNF